MIRNWAAYFLCAVSLFASAQTDIQNRIRSSEGTKPRVSTDLRHFDTFPAENSGRNSLDSAAQAQISAAIGRDQPAYQLVAGPKGFHGENAAHGLAAEFSPTGVDFRSGSNHWGVALRGYGYGHQLVSVASVSPRASANRLEYRRGNVTEWYVNGPAGVEQGFTIASRPGRSGGEPLALALTLSGDLAASVERDNRSLVLKKNGADILHYTGLMAIDANGRELPAHLSVINEELRFQIDDRGAEYPVTIDPFTQAVKLTTAVQCQFGGYCDDGHANSAFGTSIGISGDGSTVVVVTQPESGIGGAAYVFLRPSGIGIFRRGWNSLTPIYFAAKLTPSDIPGYSTFGGAVAISADGSTIVVTRQVDASLYEEGDGLGIAYVYVKPSTGWVSATQTAELAPSDSCCFGEGMSTLAVSGDGSTVALGWTAAPTSGGNTGAVYLFLRPSTGWANASAQNAKLSPSDGYSGTLFGQSISLSNDGHTAAIGNVWAISGGPAGQGAVYVYTATPRVFCILGSGCSVYYEWSNRTETAQLTASDGVQNGGVGMGVAISGDGTTIVAAGNSRPKGYVYIIGPNGWTNSTETARLTQSDLAANFSFDAQFEPNDLVSISGDGRTVALGDPYPPTSTLIPGQVLLYGKPANGWVNATESDKITASDGTAGDLFGWSVALSNDGGTVAVGAYGAAIGANLGEGAAYVFTGGVPRPVASVSPTSLTFGPQAYGTTSAPQTITLSNTGTAPLNVANVSATSAFQATQNCVAASPIAPGNSCSESVVFEPSSVGPASGNLTFTDDSGEIAGSLQQVQLTGTGVTASTSTAITAVAPNPAVTAEPVVVSYSVTPPTGVTGTPSGVIVINASTGESCTGTAPAGSCAIAFGTAGSRTLTASYGGDLNFNPSTSASVTEVVNKAATTTSVTSSLNPSFSGQSVTFTVTVTGAFGGTPTGSVVLKDGSATLTALTLGTSGTVTYSTTQLTVGSHAISASYVGDANFLASSKAITQVVKKNTTTTAVTSSLNPSNVGQSVTLTAAVSSTTGGSIPDGETVTFKYGTTVLGTATTSAGSASVTTSTLPAGSDTVVATYAGDANFAASSGSIKQVVNKFATTTVNTSSLNPSTVGQAVTFTATVSSTGGAIPDGDTVTFKYGSTVLGTASTTSGSASLTVSTLPAGSDSIVGAFAGDPTFAASNGTIKQVVNKFATITLVTSSPNPSLVGSTVTVTASVSSGGGAIPDGETVTFKYGTTVLGTATTLGGVASLNVATLPSGSDTVVGTYAGDANFAASSGSVVQKVQ